MKGKLLMMNKVNIVSKLDKREGNFQLNLMEIVTRKVFSIVKS